MKRVFSTLTQMYFLVFTFILIIVNSCTVIDESKIVLSSNLPDYQINYSGDIDYIQSQFDEEMWKTFIALTWPAEALKPIANGNILDNHDARSVFENYSFNYDLFLLNADSLTDFKPVDWGDSESLNKQRKARWTQWHEHKNVSKIEYCPDLIAAAKKVGITNMAQIIPLDEFIQASNHDRPHVPQVDKNKNFVWSGVVFNKVTFDFVKSNKLYSEEGIHQAKAKINVHKEVVHHVNSELDDIFVNQMVNSMEDKTGAMHLKTSWKILEPGEDTTRFHTAWAALLFNNLNLVDGSAWEPQCSLARVGLVGMHISVKTVDQPDFIWATFEHVDNCPEVGNIEDRDYTFYDSLSTATINKAPSPNDSLPSTLFTDPKWFNPNPIDPTNTPDPSQIVREIPIPDNTKALNKRYQKALNNSVWANYQLVGSQWIDPKSQKVYPKLLSNTTLETFDQSGSSCFGCHHQVTANTLKRGLNNDQFTMDPYPVGNVLNVKMNLTDQSKVGVIDTAIYSDYMWSLLKWTDIGHLTWKQTKRKRNK